jgi:hypothetical protein
VASYRISKYDPTLRGPDGSYKKDDWTSVSDIGASFGGEVLLPHKYSEIEDAYVEAVARMMVAAGVTALSVHDLEVHDDGTPERGLPAVHSIPWPGDGQVLCGPALFDAVRAGLREKIWCRLAGADEFFVHFGYDYYLYVGGSTLKATPAMPAGIYAEVFESPYHPEERREPSSPP